MDPKTPVEEIFRLNKLQRQGLKKMGIESVRDLLYFFPTQYSDHIPPKKISEIREGEVVSLSGKLSKPETGKTFRTKKSFAQAVLIDETGKIKIFWFSQPYLAKMFPEGSLVKVEGKISERKGKLSLTNPKIEKTDNIPLPILGDDNQETRLLNPTYRETKAITSRWLFFHIQKILKSDIWENMSEAIPKTVLEKYNLPGLKTSLIWIHSPRKKEDYLSARKRFAFEEIFYIQLQKQQGRKKSEQKKSFKIQKSEKSLEGFVNKLPYKLTAAQKKAVSDILKDFKRDYPMSRLLEGDVGSGKTAVAAIASYAAITTPPPDNRFGELQVAYMAPTEILANQHFKTFIEIFSKHGIKVGLITGSGCKKFPSKVNPEEATAISKSQLLKWVASGEIPVLIGTHSLIEKNVSFKNLSFVIIDEQHRFGTAQRSNLRKRSTRTSGGPARTTGGSAHTQPAHSDKDNILPHLLSMTATPIPRTLALTIYGDLDLTLLDQMPPGRKQVETKVIAPEKRIEAYKNIKKELKAGRQLYVVCPRIEEPDPTKALALNVKSVTEEAARLKKEVFPEYEIGILHGKLKKDEKEKVMNDFAEGKINILCATSVVEVGINVPNATMIVIEGAERFGLAQLHQLRGRVLRSNHQAYCFVFSESKSKSSLQRLKALQEAKNGFELAEFDLAQRGAGELYGKKQWGITDLGMEAIKNIKMVEAARNEAEKIVESDPNFSKPEHLLLKEILEKQKEKIHFE